MSPTVVAISREHFNRSQSNLVALRSEFETARTNFFAHIYPGNMTPAEVKAWRIEDRALGLLVEATRIRYDAELEIQKLLNLRIE